MTLSGVEREKALEEATSLFWAKGFAETSVEDIVKSTGLNRYALYNQFGGKQEMLLEALETFYQQRKSAFMGLLEDPSIKPMQAIQHIFSLFLDEVIETGNGCLVVNTITEVAPHAPEVAAVCQSYQQEIAAFMEHILIQAQEAGELREGLHPASVAQILLTLKTGIAIRAKAGTPRGVLLDAIDAHMKALQ